jgi:hypothetical protein
MNGFLIKQSNNKEWIGCMIGLSTTFGLKEPKIEIEKLKNIFKKIKLAEYSQSEVQEFKDITDPTFKDTAIEFAVKFTDGNWARVEVPLDLKKFNTRLAVDNFMNFCFTKAKDPFE